MKRGSVTVFLTLVLVLVLSFVFSMLEGARVACLQTRAQLMTDVCMQSLFGNYHRGLWEDYRLLLLNGEGSEGNFSTERLVQQAMEELNQNLADAEEYLGYNVWELTALSVQNMQLNQYQLVTDDSAAAFGRQIRQQMQLEVAQDAINELAELQQQGAEAEAQTLQKDEQWEQAWNAMEEAEQLEQTWEQEEAEESENGQGTEEEPQPEVLEGEVGQWDENSEAVVKENPMEYVKEIKNYTMLSLVVSDPAKISTKAITNPSFLEERELQKGNWNVEQEKNILDRLWLQYYIQNYFGNYTGDSSGGAENSVLDYEMEYLIGGKTDDGENLENVMFKLLGVREAMNFVTIMQDAEKKQLALAVAAAAVGWTEIMPLVKAVQVGVLLAWAFVESVLDVRALLEGESVPFLKHTSQWSSDFTNCRESIESGLKAKNEGAGLNYSQYLQMLLFLVPERTLQYRCMDLIEKNEQIRMDCMVNALEGTVTYQADTLFWNFNVLTDRDWDYLYFPTVTPMSYCTE